MRAMTANHLRFVRFQAVILSRSGLTTKSIDPPLLLTTFANSSIFLKSPRHVVYITPSTSFTFLADSSHFFTCATGIVIPGNHLLMPAIGEKLQRLVALPKFQFITVTLGSNPSHDPLKSPRTR